MLTERRLDNAYKSAKVIPFNHDSKYIFFSDVHRGDNSMSDEFAHNQSVYFHALSYYKANGYTYVENGDGDELWEHAKFKHIRGAHSDVYYLLSQFHKEERLLMVYGNHNIALKNPRFLEKNLYHYYDEYLEKTNELFPGIKTHESLILRHEDTGQEILVVHGHQGDLMNDQMWRLSMFLLRYFWRYMHIVGFKNPSSPAKNVLKQHKIEKNFNKWIIKNSIMVICGHTHRPKFPTKDDLPYVNSGCCVHPRGITGIELVNGEIAMVNWRVQPDEEGKLFIARKVVRGPLPINYYDNPEQLIAVTSESEYSRKLSKGAHFE